jgi:hypothetical protein
MTVVLNDALKIRGDVLEKQYIPTPDMVYADDTMLVGSCPMAVQRHFDAVVEVGKSFGLELNLGKTVVLRIRGNTEINGPDGTPLKARSSCVYLGDMLCDDGRPVSEVTRRLGEARRGFQNLASVWRHANISKKRKKLILDACIISKLLYGLESLWLLKCDRDKMDGFYSNCLRRIQKIPAPFNSSVSHAIVLRNLESNLWH